MSKPDAHEAGPPVRMGRWSRGRLSALSLLVITAVGIFLCYRLARPCLASLAWAAALALVFAPLHRRLELKIPRPNLAAAVSLAVIRFLVILPATWLAQRLAVETPAGAEAIQQKIASGKWRAVGAQHPRVGSLMLYFSLSPSPCRWSSISPFPRPWAP